jgi:hypothetical protein
MLGYKYIDVDVTAANPPDAAQLQNDTIDTNVAIATEYYKYLNAKAQAQDPNFASTTLGFIPFNLGLTMDGISGIKIYNEVNVSTRFLPKTYPDKLRFIIKGVTHKIQNQDWETSLETVVIPNTLRNKPQYDLLKSIMDSDASATSSFGSFWSQLIQKAVKEATTTTTTTATSPTKKTSGGSQQARATAKYGKPPQEGGVIPLVKFWTPYPLFYSGAQVKNSQTATNRKTKKTVKVKLSDLTWDRTNKYWTDPNGVYGDVNATYTTPKDSLITVFKVHEDEKSTIEKCYTDIKKEYGLEKIYELGLNTCSGTYCARNVRGGNTYSMHSWGTAIDILAGLNPNNYSKSAPFRKPEYTKFLDIMESNGWYSGGRAWDRDYMHFQTTKP